MLYGLNPSINKYFNDNWMSTPVQYEGIRFESPADGEWISISLHPYEREEQTFGNNVTFENGLLKIFSYSTSSTLAYKLAQEVSLFIEETFIDEAFIGVGKGDSNGAIPLDNNIYEVLTLFEVILSQNIKG